MKSAALALVLVLAFGSVHAAEPRAVLNAPARSELGSPILLNPTGSAADEPIEIELAEGPGPAPVTLLFTSDFRPAYGMAVATAPGVYRFVLVASGTPEGKTKPVRKYAFASVTVGNPGPGPVPPGPLPPGPLPPDPGPKPPPVPPVPPVPVPAGLRVILMYESSAPMTKGQQAAFYSTAVRDYLSRKCSKDSDGRPAWRAWDRDTDASAESKTWQEAWAAAKATVPADKLPQVVVFSGQAGKSFPVPEGEGALLALLKQFAGD